MTPQTPDTPKPVPTPKAAAKPRSEALEAELAMLEAIMPETDGSAQPVKVDPPTECGGTR